jgi:hypothetical protein
MPFDPRTMEWVSEDPGSDYFQRIANQQLYEGQPSGPPSVRPPGVTQGMQDQPMGPPPGSNISFGPSRINPTARYGGQGGDVLNSMANATSIAQDTQRRGMEDWNKEQRRTEDRRATEASDISNLERLLFDEAKNFATTNYQHPTNIQEKQGSLQKMLGSLGAMRSSRIQPTPRPQYQSPWDEGMQGSVDRIGAQNAASRKEITDAALAKVHGFITPPGGSPPSMADAKGVETSIIAQADQKRKDAALKVTQDNAESLGKVRVAQTALKEKILRGDITPQQAIADLPILLKAALDLEMNLARNPEPGQIAAIQQSLAEINRMRQDLESIAKKGTSQSNPDGTPAPTAKTPESSGDWLGSGLKWLGEQAGMKTAPPQDQAPQSRQQAAQQAYAPPMSNAVRKGMELQKRMDSGQATNEDKATYNHWYSIYTDLLSKKIPQIQAVETASKAVFGSF